MQINIYTQTINEDSGTYRIGELFAEVCEELGVEQAAKSVKTQATTEPTDPNIKRDQELMRDARETMRMLERQRAIDSAPPEVAPVLESIMDELDEMQMNTPIKTQPTPPVILQTPSSAARLDTNIHSQQPTDTSSPIDQYAAFDPTDAELNEVFKADAEGRKHVPKGALASTSTTVDSEQSPMTLLDVDENVKMGYNQRRRTTLAQRADLFEPIDSTPKTSSVAESRPYTVFHEANIGETRSRSSHRRRANKELYARLESDNDFREQMNQLFGYDVMAYMKTGKGALKNPSPDLVWHHPVDNRFVVELICKKDHQNPKLQKYLHSGEGGRGGYGLYYN